MRDLAAGCQRQRIDEVDPLGQLVLRRAGWTADNTSNRLWCTISQRGWQRWRTRSTYGGAYLVLRGTASAPVRKQAR
jgi:hypothetical protein